MSFLKNMMWSPLEYAKASVLAREVGEELFSRLDWLTINPRMIVDMGCGTGEMAARLQARYSDAKVMALDISENMLQKVKSLSVCSDAGQLPLRDQSVDLIFANLLLPWHDNIKILFKEWKRVLRQDGVLIFSALGPDTLKEWRHIFSSEMIPIFFDMHDLGDGMLHEKFADPVLDVNHYTLTYREQAHLFQELQASGMLLTSAPLLQNNELAYTDEGRLAVTYEVIFGHAFVPAESDEVSASSDGVVRVPLSHLRRRRA